MTTLIFKSITTFVTNGPALSAEFEERGTDPAMLQRVEALFKAVEDLTTDVNDH